MTTLLPNGKQQFCDAAGVSLALGSVGFYVPGTLSPKVTWKDSLQSAMNANPVPLDIGGYAVIFGNGDYRQIVKDVNGNTIWDQLTSAPLVAGDTAAIVASAVAAASTATAAQAAAAAASALTASNASAAAALAAATAGVYVNAAASNVPRGAAINVLTPGSGGTNGTNYVATYTGGNYIGNPTILYDVVAGAVANVRLTDPGLYIGSSPTAPTVVLGSGAGSPALTLTNVFRIGTGSGYWVQSADTLTLDRYKNVGGVATTDPGVQSLPTEPALLAAMASFANVPIPLNNNALVDLIQAPYTAATYNADGTVNITTGQTFRIDALTPELLAARIAGTSVTFIVEVVSGTLTTASLREYTLPNGQFGAGSVTTTVMTLAGGRYSVTKALVATDQSIDVSLASGATAIVRPLGYAIGGTPARAIVSPTLITTQSIAVDAANDPVEIAHTEALTISAGTPTLASGVLTVPNGANGYIDFALPKTLVDGDSGILYFKCSVPTGQIFSASTTYGPTGGGLPSASLATVVIEQFGPTDFRVLFNVLALTPGEIFYGVRLNFNSTSSVTRVLSGARFYKGSTLPRFMAVPAVVATAITTAVQAESDAGALVRRLWILADSVFQSTSLTFAPAAQSVQTYLGPRARVKSLAVPGSGLRAMLAMAGISGAPPATGPIVTITGNQIPASGSVAVTAWTGDPLTTFYTANPTISTVFYLRGVKMQVRITAWTGQFFPSPGSFFLDRVTPGVVVPCPAGSQLIGEQAFQMRDDFVMIEGSINPSNPSMTVLQGAATFFAARDARSPAANSLFMPNLIAVQGTTPVTQNPGHTNTAALVASYGATRILDLNASGIPSGNYLTTDEAAMLATAGFSPSGTDNAYMALGWRPPGLAQGDLYHPNDLCSLLIGYRVAMCSAVQSYMENLV